MFEIVKKILTTSIERDIDLSIAHAQLRNEERLAGIDDHSKLDKAYKLVSDYEAVVTKMWREQDVSALEELCKLYKNDDVKFRKLVSEWSL